MDDGIRAREMINNIRRIMDFMVGARGIVDDLEWKWMMGYVLEG
jgi:hypothetical protein